MKSIPAVPPETARSVRAVFGSNNFYLRVGDQLDAILAGLHVTNLLAAERSTTSAVPMLALITSFQFVEALSDVQAADALRSRQEWKYALHLPMIAPVVPETAFCRYRQELLMDPVASREMQVLLFRLHRLDPKQPPMEDVRNVLLTICSLNRLLWLYRGIDDAIKLLAAQRAEWLGEVARPYWYTLYRAVAPEANNSASKEAADALSTTIGADICYLLQRIDVSGDRELAYQPEIVSLKRLWADQFEYDHAGQISLRQYCGSCGAGSRDNLSGVSPDDCAGGGDDDKSGK